MIETSAAPAGSRRLATAWLLYLATLVSGLPLAMTIATATPRPPGACSGIGWGCSLYGWDAAGFVLLIVGIPYAIVLAAVLGLLSLLPEPRRQISSRSRPSG